MVQGLKLASAPAAPDGGPIRPDVLREFGDYELLGEIARGGMGMVYQARQRSLDRFVAVKTLLFGPKATPESVQRFRAEASAAAALQHPNIVAIHEVGVHQGEHYLVMDLVDGPNLAKFIKDQPLPARRAAGYLKTIAEAIHYAHERGILHRDLKPSNVLIDANDQPRVTDFGLAKRLEGDSSLTLSGQMLGSPSYMPPEQAGATRHKVGRRSDVYSLGAMLYHMLVGRPPFVGEGLNQTLDQVFNREPVSPRLLNPAVPRDLETICLKCLEKEPTRRYGSARELADELGRFLRDELVLARPVGPTGKVWRWAHRKPALATLIVLLHLAGAVGLTGILWQWRRAELNAVQLNARSTELRRNLYASDMKRAQQALAANNLGLALELLDEHRPKPGDRDDLRGWEWRYLWQQSRPGGLTMLCQKSNAIASLAVSHDGKWLAIGDYLWNAASRQRVRSFPLRGRCRRPIRFSADGQSLVTSVNRGGIGNPICFWQVADGSELTNYSIPHGEGNWGSVWPLAVAKDLSAFACGVPGGELQVVDWATLTNRWRAPTEAEVVTVAFSPDGKILASSSGLGYSTIRLWDVGSGKEIRRLEGHSGWISALVFWPDGKTLASASGDQTIRLWNLSDLTNVPPPQVLIGHKSEVWDLALLHDNRMLVSGSKDGSVCLWDTAQPRRERTHVPLRIRLRAAPAFAPDSKSVFTLDNQGNVSR